MPDSIRLCLLACLLFAGGCSWFSWLPWVDEKDEDPTEPAKLVRFDQEVNLKKVWSRGVGDGLGRKYLRLNPAVAGDRVFAADGYGHVMAFDLYSGKRVWAAAVDPLEGGILDAINFFDRRDPSFLSGGVGIGEGYVLIGLTTGWVVALNAADGTEAWRTRVDSEVLSAPAGGGGNVYAQTVNGSLLALDAATGDIRWSFDNQLPVLTLRGTSAPVYDAGVVYAGFASGKVSALKADSGEPVWEQRIMLPEGRSELQRMVDVDAQPLVNSGVLYAAAYQGRVKALRQRDGGQLWEVKSSSHLDLAEGYGHIYVVTDNDTIQAIDRQSAEIVWEQPALLNRKLSPPVAFSNYLVVGDEEGYLHVMAQSDGRMIGRRKVDGDGVRSRMTVADRWLIVQGNSGSLQAIDIVAR